jgi:hypothetical protein
MARKSTDYVQFKLRIRESLRRKIERAAEKKAISANAEAVERIEKTFAEEERQLAFEKEMDERREELDAQYREYHEEQARKDAEYEAALRDSLILNIILREQPLLRRIAMEIDVEPEWRDSVEMRKALADRLHQIIVSNDFSGDDE